MASLPTEQDDLTFTIQLEAAARRQMSAALAELESYRLTVARVRMFCDVRAKHGLETAARRVSRDVLDLLSDLP